VSGDSQAHSVPGDAARPTARNGLSAAVTDLPDDTAFTGPREGRWRVRIRLAIAVTFTLLVAGAALVGPGLWGAAPDDPVQLVSGRLIGDTAGYVAGVDRERRTVAVSRSVFGWRPVVFSVNPDTVITVQSREGALGDLASDMLVRVTYEIVGAARIARSIEIGAPRADPPPSVVAPPAGTVPTASAPLAPEPPASSIRQSERKASSAALPDLPSSSAPRSAPAAGRLTPSPTAAQPSPSAPSAPVASSPPVVRAEPRQPSASADVAPGVARGREQTESESADGSAAIDWLLNQSPRR
jgi:hypothetical protein